MRRVLLVLLFLLPALGLAQSDASEDERKLLSAEVLWQLERIGAPVISPDGQWLVAPVTSYDVETDKGETRLWLFSPDGSVERPLTSQGQSASSPAFSPDSSRLAFVSSRSDDEAGQIYVLPMSGPGEASRLSEVPTGVSSLKWVGEHLYFISSVWPDLDWEETKEQLKEDKDSKVSAKQWNAMPYSSWDRWLDEDRQNHLFRLSADGGEVEALTLPLGRELSRSGAGGSSYDVHPDETRFAFVSDSHGGGVVSDYDLFLAPMDGGEAHNLTADNPAGDSTPMFSPDGESLAWLQQSLVGFYADTRNIIIHDLDSGQRQNITAGWDRSAGGLVW